MWPTCMQKNSTAECICTEGSWLCEIRLSICRMSGKSITNLWWDEMKLTIIMERKRTHQCHQETCNQAAERSIVKWDSKDSFDIRNPAAAALLYGSQQIVNYIRTNTHQRKQAVFEKAVQAVRARVWYG